ncbi:tetratricopeptide repeat domain-containing protein [Xylaria intraflava]|nr:tetratricopeptide repeat domain-containing protein [Xylaria intraflava]
MVRRLASHRARDAPEGNTGVATSVNPASARSSLGLGSVIQLRSEAEPTMEASIIAIPGYRTPPVGDWNVESQLREAGESVPFSPRLHVYIHQPGLNPAEGFSWESFLKSGSDLAEDIANISEEFPKRPIIFIAHSLGGLLLKRALILAHQNLQDSRFRLVIECLSGILFLGTPHSGPTDKDTITRHNAILYSCAKLAIQKRSSRLPDRDVFQLASLASSFQRIAQVPILSVFENSDPSLDRYRRFGISRKKILVDEQLATISSHAETLLGVRLNHKELCKMSKLEGDAYSAKDFLHSLFEDLATNEKWSLNTEALSTQPQRPLLPETNPLNPLNLAPVTPDKPATSTPVQTARKSRLKGWSITKDSSRQLQRRNSLIATNSNRLVETRKAHLPYFNLAHHTQNPEFVGREDIFLQIDKYLLPRRTPTTGNMHSTRSFALCGMGGIGKTSLAVEYAFSREGKFGAVFWIEAGGVSQLMSDFSHISTRLGLETPEEAIDIESSKEIAKAWLNKPRSYNPQSGVEQENDSWLLIFDNADNLDIIAEYIPYHGNGSILVTSRDPFAKNHFFTNGGGVDMEPLKTAEAAGLLQRLVISGEGGNSADEKDASFQVAKSMDGLPLAMSQMAGFIRRRQLSIREFANLYSNDDQYAIIHGVSNPIQDRRYGRTLASAYTLEELGEDAARLLQLLAFLNPDRVPEDVFLNPITKSTNSVQGESWTPSTFEKARYELLNSSLIKRNIQKKELWIHRVVQAEVRARMKQEHRYDIFKQAVQLLAGLWPPGDHCSQVTERWAICENLLPHLERFYQLYIDHPDWEQYEVDPTFPMLMNEVAVYLHERCFSHEGKAYLKLALRLSEKAQITQEPLVSDMHLTMGALANETNDAQTCLDHNVICLALRRAEAARTGQADLRLAFAHSQMGIAYMMVKKFALATEYFQQSVELLKIIEADVDDYGFPVCNLGLAYWIQGELDDAEKTLMDLLAQREAAFGKLDTVSYKTGRVLQALGNVKASKAMSLDERGDEERAKKYWDESLEIHMNCLKQYEATLGKFAHRTADACHKLAEHYIRLKQHTLAQDYLDRALSIWGDREWYRNESARSSFLRGTHLVSLNSKEYVEEGKKWLERAKVLRADILPDEKPGKLTTMDFDDIVCFWSI